MLNNTVHCRALKQLQSRNPSKIRGDSRRKRGHEKDAIVEEKEDASTFVEWIVQPKRKQRKCSISFPETARSRSHHAFYEPQPPRTLTGNELVLDGGREAADVGGIDAEGSVYTRKEGVGGRERKGSTVDSPPK